MSCFSFLRFIPDGPKYISKSFSLAVAGRMALMQNEVLPF
jgi:hypothetical protein